MEPHTVHYIADLGRGRGLGSLFCILLRWTLFRPSVFCTKPLTFLSASSWQNTPRCFHTNSHLGSYDRCHITAADASYVLNCIFWMLKKEKSNLWSGLLKPKKGLATEQIEHAETFCFAEEKSLQNYEEAARTFVACGISFSLRCRQHNLILLCDYTVYVMFVWRFCESLRESSEIRQRSVFPSCMHTHTLFYKAGCFYSFPSTTLKSIGRCTCSLCVIVWFVRR